MTLRKIPTEQFAVDPDPILTYATPLQVLVSHKDDRTHVVLVGELDVSTARFLAEQLIDATAASAGDVVIDIGLLDFIGSTGISVIISQHKTLQAQGRTLTVLDPTPSARRLFEITGLDQVLTIEPAIVPTAGAN
ncbi:MAG: STAS domain-containing protein [Acidimicrobiales bacterium]